MWWTPPGRRLHHLLFQHLTTRYPYIQHKLASSEKDRISRCNIRQDEPRGPHWGKTAISSETELQSPPAQLRWNHTDRVPNTAGCSLHDEAVHLDCFYSHQSLEPLPANAQHSAFCTSLRQARWPAASSAMRLWQTPAAVFLVRLQLHSQSNAAATHLV